MVRRLPERAFGVFVVLLMGAASRSIDAAEAERPNVVLIFADDFGRELLAAYGGRSYETPNINRLAENGLTFETCYATPLCSPSRVELMTSQYSFRSYTTWGEIDRQADTFVRRLRESGYQTIVSGKWHMSGWNETPLGVTVAGFDRHCCYDYAQVLEESKEFGGNQYWGGRYIEDGQAKRLDRYGPDLFVDYACDRIRDRNPARPFFAYLALNTMHRPFFPTPDHPDAPEPGQPVPHEWLGHKGDQANFKPMLAYADKLVGRVMKTLQEQGLEESTLVLFTADNGTDNVHEAKGVRSQYRGRLVDGGKYFPTEMGLNVPLLAYWPGVVSPGTRTDALVDLTDLGATFCDLAGCVSPNDTDGRSLQGLLRGTVSRHKSHLYSFGNYERSSRRYKDPRNHTKSLFDVVRGPTWKWVSRGQIYNLNDDWFEESPVAPPESRAVRAELRGIRDKLRSSNPKLW